LKKERILLAAGLIAGLLAGLAYAWLINPVTYFHTTPACLPPDHQQRQIELIASAYAATGDLDRALNRLAQLGLDDTAGSLRPGGRDSRTALADAASSPSPGHTSFQAQAMHQLADALDRRFAAPEPTPSSDATSISLLQDTPTPMPVVESALSLTELRRICDPEINEPVIRFQVTDRTGSGVPEIQIEIAWVNGYNRLYTGLKPAVGAGYADFAMEEGTVYTMKVSGLADQITGLKAEDCFTELGQRYPGSWAIQLRQNSP
jgi:hypothetical protein